MKILEQLIKLMSSFRKMVLLAIILGWATAISWIALISTSSYLISYASLRPSIAAIQLAIVGVRFFGLSRGVFRYFDRLISHSVTFKLLANLRVWLYKKIESLSFIDFQALQKGDLLSRILDDVEVLQEFYVRVLGPTVIALLTSISVFLFSYHWSVKAALVIMGFHLILGGFVPLLIRRISRRDSILLGQTKSKFSIHALDIIHGQPDIIAFGQTAHFFNEAQKIIDDEKGAEAKMNHFISISSGFVSIVMGLISIPLFIILIPEINSGFLDGKILAVLILGSLASFEVIMTLPSSYQNMDKTIIAGNRLFEIINKPPQSRFSDKKNHEYKKPSFEFKNINFSYSQNLIVKNLSFSLPFQKKLAIVGDNGSGKTTIANLIMGFIEPSTGKILLNGQNTKNLNCSDLLNLISYVPQNAFIFNGSIEENIRLGKPTATQGEIYEAAQKAIIHDFILGLPDGYQTIAGEFGALLSGGERQRLVIARAILKDAPLFILDEPFANLDRITIKLLSQSLMQIVKDRSLLLITHQLIGLSAMDEIILLQGGKIIERGTEKELMFQNHTYRKLLDLQQDIISD